MDDTTRAIRRQLTILNVDLVDSTAYADRLDPEVFRSMLRRFFDQSQEIVERSSGRLVMNMGDGFVAIFGYPRTHRMAEVNAVTCGLELAEMMAGDEIFAIHGLKARFGIATGPVIVSTDSGDGLFDNVPFGSPAHRAARLQELAPPERVAVDQTTYQNVNRLFHFSPLGARELKGFGEASMVWQVDGRQTLESRFQEHTARFTPMVGRTHEIARLMELWRRAKSRDGQKVLMIGEPGVGKSRVIYEFRQQVTDDAPDEIVLQCEEGFENTALHPWARFIERRAGLGRHEKTTDKDAKLREQVRAEFGVDDDLAAFFVSLTAFSQASGPGDDQTPERKLEAIRDALVAQLLHIASGRPLLLVLEDAHWIDPTSRLVIEALIARAAEAQIFLLISSRPGTPLAGRAGGLTELHINRLSRDQARNLAVAVVGGSANAERYIERIVQRADGNPLYVEELARSARSSLDSGTEDQWPEADEGDAPLPERLQTLLEARLDRLAPNEKTVTEAAAVIGQEFEIALLAQLLGRREAQLAEEVNGLVEAEIFASREWDPPGHFRFRHALLQQAAYANVLRGASTTLHRRLIDLMRTNDPGIDDKSPQIIAHHLTRSGQFAEAAQMWLKAARGARETGSNLEALGRLDHGLHHVLPRLEEPDLELRMAYQLARGEVINAHYGPVRPDARAAFEEAAALGYELGDANGVTEAHTGLFHLTYVQANFKDALASCDVLVNQPEIEGQPHARAMGFLGAGMCRFALGAFEAARADLERSVSASRQHGDAAGSYLSKAFIYLGLTNQAIGNDKEATRLCMEGLERARKQDATILSAALGNVLYLDHMQARPDNALKTAEELLTLTEQKGFMMWFYHARFWRGWAMSLADEAEGLTIMEDAMSRFFQSEEVIETTIFFCAQSEAYLSLGDLDQAEASVDRALAHAEQTGEKFYEVPLLRQKIACLTIRNPSPLEEIAELHARAEARAKEQGAWTSLLAETG